MIWIEPGGQLYLLIPFSKEALLVNNVVAMPNAIECFLVQAPGVFCMAFGVTVPIVWQWIRLSNKVCTGNYLGSLRVKK
jgi:hypothetical protein